MTRFLPFMLLAGFAAEIASIIWVGKTLGVLPTLLLMLVAGAVGIKLIKSAGMSFAGALRSPVQTATLAGAGGSAAARVIAGVLFLLPGFFSDLAGLVLLVPAVQRWIGRRFQVDAVGSTRQPERRFERVIDVEAVEITDDADRTRDNAG